MLVEAKKLASSHLLLSVLYVTMRCLYAGAPEPSKEHRLLYM